MIEYCVRLADPRRHLFEVDCRIESAAEVEDFQLPSWIPGSYLLREYARHVVSACAFDARGEALPLEKLDHNTWRCHSRGSRTTLRLTVYALDESVRGAWLDTQRAWFNGPCLFARPLSQADAGVRVVLERPAEPLDRWSVATAMSPLAADSQGFGEYHADDYDELIDHPVAIGNLECIEFEAGGTPHRVVFIGTHDGDIERVANDLRCICNSQLEFFGEPTPFDRYVFLCLVVADGYGGLEHSYSSMLMFGRDNLPKKGEEKVSKGYQRTLSLASHEYFHTWHVKRTRPEAFMPYRLTDRNFTRLLWVFEGITSYYQDRFLLRSGVIGRRAYLRRLEELIASVLQIPGRYAQSLAESSFDAWDRLYKPNANTVNAGVSYYSKGALVALALDLEIRRRHTSQSLDDVVQSLWREYGSKEIGVPEDGFERLAIRIAGNELADFFDRMVRGTEDPPLAQLFETLAITLEPAQSPPRAWLGIVARQAAGGVECASVLDSGPAQAAGLNPRDIIVAVNRRKVTSENLNDILDRFGIGAQVSLEFFRGDELHHATTELTPSPPKAYSLNLDEDANAHELALRDAWLAG